MSRSKSYGLFEFDDLDPVMPTGWRVRAGFEGRARVEPDGQIVEITVRAYRGGKTQLMLISPEDGPLYADLLAALHDQYASSIAEAAESAEWQDETRPAYSYAG